MTSKWLRTKVSKSRNWGCDGLNGSKLLPKWGDPPSGRD